ncbi:RNA chaperone Hfq [Paenibacillus sp. GP183]|uniref:RNA chaperone Hfq n=1 Tax=Paenibacillus sp. GP183 TaxID=1882751 RepID=UPI000B8800DA|nr:RNA chaperone Hfq [Paenibacillus sp. GP183]
MQQKIDIQSTFLNEVLNNKVSVTVILVNGFQIRGTIKHHYSFTVELESEGKQQVIYKHAISTIIPINPVNISGAAQ